MKTHVKQHDLHCTFNLMLYSGLLLLIESSFSWTKKPLTLVKLAEKNSIQCPRSSLMLRCWYPAGSPTRPLRRDQSRTKCRANLRARKSREGWEIKSFLSWWDLCNFRTCNKVTYIYRIDLGLRFEPITGHKICVSTYFVATKIVHRMLWEGPAWPWDILGHLGTWWSPFTAVHWSGAGAHMKMTICHGEKWIHLENLYLLGGWTLPLWKIWIRQFGWWHSQLNGKKKSHVPVTTNHIRCNTWSFHSQQVQSAKKTAIVFTDTSRLILLLGCSRFHVGHAQHSLHRLSTIKYCWIIILFGSILGDRSVTKKITSKVITMKSHWPGAMAKQ